MNRVAVIFTGFFRTFNFTKDSFKFFIMDPLNADIFFSSPKTLYTLAKDEDPNWPHILEEDPNKNRPDHYSYLSINDKCVGSEIIDFFGDKLKAYELIDYSIEPYIELCRKNNIPDLNFNGALTFRILSQLSGIEKSANIFKKYVEQNNITYDLVIMTRGDNKYFTPFDINALDMDKLNYPDHNRNQGGFHYLPPNTPPSNKIHKTFSDHMLVGSQKNMLVWNNIASSSFDHFREGMYYTTENLMAYHLIKNNVDWCGTNYIEHALWRHEE